MNTPTFPEKLALAKAFPEWFVKNVEAKYEQNEYEPGIKFRWVNTNNSDYWEDWFEVTNREWLQVCWECEELLSRKEFVDYVVELRNECSCNPMHATASQRIIALCKVKGVETSE